MFGEVVRKRDDDEEKGKMDKAARAGAAGKFQVSLDEEFPLG
jgi:hypothetical protein